MPIYLLTPEFDVEGIAPIERKIRSAIPDLVQIGSMDELAARPAQSVSANYVLLVAPGKGGYSANLLEFVTKHRHQAFIILISDDISAADYKALVRTGAADWVAISAVPQEIVDIVARHRSAAPGSSTGRSQPSVVALVPSAGGVGNATLAVEIATHLKTHKATTHREICIVDLDFQSSHVCDLLDIEPRLRIQEISSNPERLDHQLFDLFISRHVSGLHVFAAPRTKFNPCDLDVSALDALFDMIMARYDLILIDLPGIWFPWTFQIVAGADGLIVTGPNTIPGLRQLAETVTTVRGGRPAPGSLAVAVNRCTRRLIGGIARQHHVEKVLRGEQVFYVDDDPMLVHSSNAGTPLASTHAARRTSKQTASIAAFCAELQSSRVRAG